LRSRRSGRNSEGPEYSGREYMKVQEIRKKVRRARSFGRESEKQEGQEEIQKGEEARKRVRRPEYFRNRVKRARKPGNRVRRTRRSGRESEEPGQEDDQEVRKVFRRA
jgi:hypothetical protein